MLSIGLLRASTKKDAPNHCTPTALPDLPSAWSAREGERSVGVSRTGREGGQEGRRRLVRPKRVLTLGLEDDLCCGTVRVSGRVEEEATGCTHVLRRKRRRRRMP